MASEKIGEGGLQEENRGGNSQSTSQTSAGFDAPVPAAGSFGRGWQSRCARASPPRGPLGTDLEAHGPGAFADDPLSVGRGWRTRSPQVPLPRPSDTRCTATVWPKDQFPEATCPCTRKVYLLLCTRCGFLEDEVRNVVTCSAHTGLEGTLNMCPKCEAGLDCLEEYPLWSY